MKYKNISPYDLDVPVLHRVVEAGTTVNIPKALAARFAGQDAVWEPQASHSAAQQDAAAETAPRAVTDTEEGKA